MSLVLTADEVVAITGYRRSADQLRELHAQGFVRARLNRLGEVVLERDHYVAVCQGRYARPLDTAQNERPRVRIHAKATA